MWSQPATLQPHKNVQGGWINVNRNGAGDRFVLAKSVKYENNKLFVDFYRRAILTRS